jgi:hypothetical protein
MEYNRIPKRITQYKPIGYTDVGRPRRKWEDPWKRPEVRPDFGNDEMLRVVVLRELHTFMSVL